MPVKAILAVSLTKRLSVELSTNGTDSRLTCLILLETSVEHLLKIDDILTRRWRRAYCLTPELAVLWRVRECKGGWKMWKIVSSLASPVKTWLMEFQYKFSFSLQLLSHLPTLLVAELNLESLRSLCVCRQCSECPSTDAVGCQNRTEINWETKTTMKIMKFQCGWLHRRMNRKYKLPLFLLSCHRASRPGWDYCTARACSESPNSFQPWFTQDKITNSTKMRRKLWFLGKLQFSVNNRWRLLTTTK